MKMRKNIMFGNRGIIRYHLAFFLLRAGHREREREVWVGVNTQAYSDSIVWFGSKKPVCKQSG